MRLFDEGAPAAPLVRPLQRNRYGEAMPVRRRGGRRADGRRGPVVPRSQAAAAATASDQIRTPSSTWSAVTISAGTIRTTLP